MLNYCNLTCTDKSVGRPDAYVRERALEEMCVCVCVSCAGVGERARMDIGGRERRMVGADRRAIDSRETPHRPGPLTDGGPAPRL